MNAPTHRLRRPRGPLLPTVLLAISTVLLAALVVLTACSPSSPLTALASATPGPTPTPSATPTPVPPVSINITLTLPSGSTVEVLPSARALPPPAAVAPAAPVAPSGLPVVPYVGRPPTVTGTYPVHCTARGPPSASLPDPACTPGAVGNTVTQATIDKTICVPNWTDTIRPSSSVTSRVKTSAMAAYAVTAPRTRVELDHLVSLGLGGADDVSNLWPQVSDLPGNTVNNTKDQVERVLITSVCKRKVTLADAQRAIARDWTTARAALGV